ncbi:unnamed protein product [Cuscuta campestris]|uniref:Replication protein A 70 kDa DNA-binding subunit B/D first OB fold domain-containing protein n=1 Tax=Cuscuta campestris TaxID=132261 RepID=A0A484NFP6_9ASTE|nr:unnamed protein product [Cuscuta campestris]
MTMFTPIAELNRDKNSWILMLRAIRVYFVPKWAKGGDSMKIVFHDEHGTRIHAHLAREEKETFETQIIEGGIYAIRNVFVHDNYQRLKTGSNDKLLGFFKRTEVKTLSRNNFPRMMFDLKPFPILQSQPCLNDQLLIDTCDTSVEWNEEVYQNRNNLFHA